MKVAIVHDYLNQLGGEERVLMALSDIFPEAPIFCAVYSEKMTAGAFSGHKIIPSWLQKLPFSRLYHRPFSFLMPYVVETMDLRGFDLVISLTASFSKGLIIKPETLHICYLNTPTRFLWDDSITYLKRSFVPRSMHSLASTALSMLRVWDQQAIVRPDHILANSKFVQNRIVKYYKRDSTLLYPPVNISSFYSSSERDEYYLMVGRLIDYKRFDLGMQACKRLGRKLKIIGTGPELKKLKSISDVSVEFLGYVDEVRLRDYYSKARALIWPQEEDFGIVQVEALASGCPVIALKAGGALEVIEEYKNGVFFDEQTVQSLADKIIEFEKIKFNSSDIVETAQKFDIKNFKRNFNNILNKVLTTDSV